jgi:hypothetical protein
MAGLTPTEVDQIRAALDAGRRPKVVFTTAAGQIAGQVGTVVELTDPDTSDEWIVVRFGKDELPFSPSDLAVPVRGKAVAAPASAVPARASGARRTTTAAAPPPEPEFVLDKTPPAPPQREGKKVTTTIQAPPAAVEESLNGAKPAKPAKAAKPKPPATLVVTLAYADREWTVAATQGTKALAKPYVIKPTEALRMVALVDVPGVHEAVEAIIAAERAEAEGRAVRLREELAELESRLAELAQSS